MNASLFGLLAVAASAALATAALGAAEPIPPNAPAAQPAPAPPAQDSPAQAAAVQAPAAQTGGPPPASSGEAPLTRAQIMEQGAKALKDTCEGVCHQSDKWEAASRDRAGWAESVDGMLVKMKESEMPLPNAKTYNLIVDYLAITRPQ